MLGIVEAWCSSRSSSSPASTRRSRSASRRRRRASCCSTSSSGSSWPRRSAGGCSTASGPSGRSCSAARSPPSASGCGPAKVTSLDFGRAGLVRHPRRRRHGVHARPGEHRRRQPGLPALLRRGDRHHPDRAELRRQPRARDPRQPARLAAALAGSRPRWSPRGCRRGAGGGRGVEHRAVHGRRRASARSPHFVRLDFAYATRSVLYAMAGIMAAAAVVAFVGLRRGVQEESVLAPETA